MEGAHQAPEGSMEEAPEVGPCTCGNDILSPFAAEMDF